MAAFRVVYPDGSTDELVGENEPSVGDLISAPSEALVVRYIQRKHGEVVAYLGPAHDELTLQKAAVFDVDGTKYLLSLAETAELADRVRSFSTGHPGSPATAVAVRLEQLVEEPSEQPAAVLGSEKDVLRHVIEDWLGDVGVQRFPSRVMILRYALFGERPQT